MKNRKWYLLLLIVAALFIFACSDDEDKKDSTIIEEPDGDNPIVNIFAPENNAIKTVAEEVDVDVFVADAGEIAEVSLYVNGTLFNTLTELPWTFSWRAENDAATVADQGTYTLTAKAIDVTGNETTSTPVYVQLTFDNVPPTEPANPTPAVEADDVQIAAPTLTWESTDADVARDELVFDLRYGTNPDLMEAQEVLNLDAAEYQLVDENLSFETEYFWQVTAKDGNYEVTGPVWSFSTILPLELPTEPYPSNEEDEVGITNIDFEWECANYADNSPITYDFWFGSDNENLQELATGLTTPNFTYDGTLEYHKEYFWSVKANDQYYNGDDGMMSSLWMFETRHIINEPVNPIPDNDSDGNAITNLQLGWTATHETGEALTYQVIISTQTNFELTDYHIVNVDNIDTNEYTIPQELTYAKKYYWRVYAKTDADSLEGPLWTFNTINPMEVVSPAHEEEDVAILDVNFDWDMMDIGADVTFDFYISTNDALDALQPKEEGIEATEFVYPSSAVADPDTLQIETTYYWRVVAKHGTPGDDDYFVINSDVWSFDTKANPINDFSNPTPAHNSEGVLVVNPELSWTCSHVDGEALTYNIWFGPDEFSLVEVATDLTETTYMHNVTLDFNKEYRWKVVATDGIFEKESELWRFYSINPFGEPMPGNGEVGISVDYTFDWELEGYSEAGMTFDLYIAETEEALDTVSPIVQGLSNPNYDVTALTPDTQYFWKVAAINSDQSSDSDVWTFTTRPADLYSWVSVSGGTYDVGTPNDDNYYDQEDVEAFNIMNTEVTNLAYKIFIVDAIEAGNAMIQGNSIKGSDGKVYYDLANDFAKIQLSVNGEYFVIEEGYENHPVTNVTWNGAHAFADFNDYSLPTEWQWEVAARGGNTEDYPWGNDAPADNMVANYRNSGDEFDNGTTPVAYFPAYHELYDMAGNVWEWTSSDSDTVDGYKILRGGSWNSTIEYLKCWVRDFDGTKNYDPEYSGSIIGFRCIQ